MDIFVPILLLSVGVWLVLVAALAELNNNFMSKLLFNILPLLFAFCCFITAAELLGWIGG